MSKKFVAAKTKVYLRGIFQQADASTTSKKENWFKNMGDLQGSKSSHTIKENI